MRNIVMMALRIVAFYTFPQGMQAYASDWHPISQCLEYTEIRTHVHLVKADLTCTNLHLVSTAEQERGSTTSQFARRTGATVAINGDYFRPSFDTLGLTITRGDRWKDSRDRKGWSFIACTVENICTIDRPNQETTPRHEWVLVLGGWQPYVDGTFVCPEPVSSECFRSNWKKKHPRTAIGLDSTKKTLFLLVAEGRLPEFQGMTLDDVSEIFKEIGIRDGLNLDGGGSSTLIVNGHRINRLPNKQNAERVVANHLGIIVSQ